MTTETRPVLEPSEVKKGMTVKMVGPSPAGKVIGVARWPGWEEKPAKVVRVDRCWVWLRGEFGGRGILKRYFAKRHYDFVAVGARPLSPPLCTGLAEELGTGDGREGDG